MIPMPIIPRSKIDPTQQLSYVKTADKKLGEIIKKITDKYIEVFKSIPRVSISSSMLVNRQYIFDVNEQQIMMMQEDLNAFIDREFNITSDNNWFFEDYVKKAYERGTRSEYANLASQSSLYASRSMGERMFAEAYTKRIALVKYRAFEEMKGLTADMKKDMALILSDAIANGYGIDKTVKAFKDRMNVNDFRARRIARTETLTAYRRARLDESQQASIDYGLRTKMMWISAFAPTSRAWHLSRHGKTYTEEEVREFYSKDGNAINCMCTQISVLVDAMGNPISDVLTRRLEEMESNAKKYREDLL